jgi:hypothetical protein
MAGWLAGWLAEGTEEREGRGEERRALLSADDD